MSVSVTDVRSGMPALLTTPSRRVSPASAAATWASSETSQMFTPGAEVMSRPVTVAPSAFAAWAMASPSPEAAPVTRIWRPEKRMARLRRATAILQCEVRLARAAGGADPLAGQPAGLVTGQEHGHLADV